MIHNLYEGLFCGFCVIGLATSIPIFFMIQSIGRIGESDCCPPPPIEKPMTPLEKFDEIANKKMDCQFCDGTGKYDYEKMKNMTVYGKSLKQIAEMLDYAYQHGYKETT